MAYLSGHANLYDRSFRDGSENFSPSRVVIVKFHDIVNLAKFSNKWLFLKLDFKQKKFQNFPNFLSGKRKLV
jgi:hypothetical protein